MNRPNINVTPLIDVLLVLLIIFMVISPTQKSSFKANIPPAAETNLPPHPNALIVTVDADYSLKLNQSAALGTVENPDQFIEKLRETFRLRQTEGVFRPGTNEIEKTVFIKAPKNISYGSVAKAVDAVKLAGAEPIGLQIEGL
jgi:biopolymer transport protein ExbD